MSKRIYIQLPSTTDFNEARRIVEKYTLFGKEVYARRPDVGYYVARARRHDMIWSAMSLGWHATDSSSPANVKPRAALTDPVDDLFQPRRESRRLWIQNLPDCSNRSRHHVVAHSLYSLLYRFNVMGASRVKYRRLRKQHPDLFFYGLDVIYGFRDTRGNTRCLAYTE